jgi:ankyrin repeat protein
MKLKPQFAFALVLSLLAITGCKPSPDALMTAVKADNTADAVKLISKGADANSRTSPNGWSALHYAARNGNPQIVQELLKAGADAGYAGSLDGKANSAVTLKPLPLAQGMLEVVGQVQPAEMAATLRQNGLDDPALLKSMTDPSAADRYRKVVELLAQTEK